MTFKDSATQYNVNLQQVGHFSAGIERPFPGTTSKTAIFSETSKHVWSNTPEQYSMENKGV